jgi:osmoprotectant transport system substrate-binding protein
MKTMNRTCLGICLVLVFALMISACASKPAANTASGSKTSETTEVTKETKQKPTIKVGSKNFTEQYILGEMYAQALEAAGYPVEKKLGLGGTLVAFEAIKAGEIDLYAEYTGTALTNILKETPSSDPDDVLAKLKKGYKEKYDIDVLDRTEFNNTWVVVTSQEVSQKYGIKTISDLAAKATELKLAVVPEFTERADGLPGLQKAYGGLQFKSTKLFDRGLKYKALTSGEVDVTLGYGTDGQITGFNLVALKDDKNFFPPYQAAAQVRGEVLRNNPEVGEILNQINKLLTDQVMSALNWKVDGDKKEAMDVAKEFLKEHGFIK